MCPLVSAVADRRFLLWALAWTAAALVGFGLTSAIVPNPVFGRAIEVTWWSYPVVVVTGILGGLLFAKHDLRHSLKNAASQPPLESAFYRPDRLRQHDGSLPQRGGHGQRQ